MALTNLISINFVDPIDIRTEDDNRELVRNLRRLADHLESDCELLTRFRDVNGNVIAIIESVLYGTSA